MVEPNCNMPGAQGHGWGLSRNLLQAMRAVVRTGENHRRIDWNSCTCGNALAEGNVLLTVPCHLSESQSVCYSSLLMCSANILYFADVEVIDGLSGLSLSVHVDAPVGYAGRRPSVWAVQGEPFVWSRPDLHGQVGWSPYQTLSAARLCQHSLAVPSLRPASDGKVTTTPISSSSAENSNGLRL